MVFLVILIFHEGKEEGRDKGGIGDGGGKRGWKREWKEGRGVEERGKGNERK